MPLVGRVGDNAQHDGDDHPAKQGSPDVFVNGKAVMRVGDPGKGWTAKKGSKGVLVNGIPVHRVGDETSHDTGDGQLVDGSQDVLVGDLGGGDPKPIPHDRSLALDVSDARGRAIQDVTVTVSCPHKDDRTEKVSGNTSLSGLCTASTVTVQKPLQKGTWDKGAQSPEILGPTHHVDAPAAVPAAAPAASPAVASPAAAPSAAPAPTHVVNAPAPPATPPAQQEVHIVKPTTSSASVKLTTVHNWVETVFAAFGQTMPTAATEIAILGVREASLSGKGTVDELEAEAGEGQTDKETTTRTTRDDNFSDDPGWNDLLFVAFTDSTPEKAQHVEVFECTIDAGAVSSDATGVPITLEGKLYGGLPGDHISSRYPGKDICLHLFTGKFGKMALARECTCKYRTFENVASAKIGATNWLFCSTEDNASIHMHFGAEYNRVGNWSEGCTVLHHHYFVKDKSGKNVVDPKAKRYARFRELFTGAANKANIPYLVVSSQYVRSYAEWAKLLTDQPAEAGKNQSVILKDKLREAPDLPGRYLPSFVQTAFAKAVNDLAADKATSPAHAANLKASMQNVTFTLSI
jgi:uncharacterized Zn-binding protein involved in type VI secretion